MNFLFPKLLENLATSKVCDFLRTRLLTRKLGSVLLFNCFCRRQIALFFDDCASYPRTVWRHFFTAQFLTQVKNNFVLKKILSTLFCPDRYIVFFSNFAYP